MEKKEQVRIDAMFSALTQQRDQAQLAWGQLAGEVAVLKAQVEELEAAARSVPTDLPTE